jgi:hypothetical protein
MFTQKMQQEMGDATLLCEGDVLYIYNTSWLLVVTGAHMYFDERILDLVQRAMEQDEGVDWRVLNAREVDEEQKTFIPARGRKSRELFIPIWNLNLKDGEQIRSFVNDNSHYLYDDGIDLAEEFLGGRGRPVYPSRAEDGKPTREPSSAASNYLFKGDGWIISANGPQLRTWVELGFSMNLATDIANRMPLVGIVHDEWEPEVFGFMCLDATTGIFKDAEGRDIYRDAAHVCWKTLDHGAELLTNPVVHDPTKVPSIDVRELLDVQTYDQWRSPLRDAIGILRWRGCTEEEIQDLYDGRREEALWELHEEVLVQADGLLNELHEYEENQEHGYYAHRIKYMDGRAKGLCEKIEALSVALEENLDLGSLPELVKALAERLECDS